MKNVLVVGLLMVLGAGCTQHPTSVTSSQTPASPTPLLLTAARLQGKWKVVPVVKSSGAADINPGEPLRPFTISFKPGCRTGPCGGTWSYFYGSLVHKQFQRVNNGSFSSRGQDYLLVLTRASLSWCKATTKNGIKTRLSYHDRAMFVVHITAATMNKGLWMATGISGVETVRFAPVGCTATTATYSVEATKLCWLDPACR